MERLDENPRPVGGGRLSFGDPNNRPDLVLNSTEFFKESVEGAFERLKVPTIPMVKSYLVNLLNHYIITDNLFETCEESGRKKSVTLAELYLGASHLESKKRDEQLKRLGDMSLYMSGFFGDSLKRKIVDIDYYVNIGGSAYGALASSVNEDTSARVFEDISENFIQYVDILTYISQQTNVQTNEDLLRLYDRYIATGSELAKEQLAEKGLLNAQSKKKVKN